MRQKNRQRADGKPGIRKGEEKKTEMGKEEKEKKEIKGRKFASEARIK